MLQPDPKLDFRYLLLTRAVYPGVKLAGTVIKVLKDILTTITGNNINGYSKSLSLRRNVHLQLFGPPSVS